MSGVHTPPMSGSFAIACQSFSVGAGLIGSFSAAANTADAVMPSNNAARKELVFMRSKITRSEPEVAKLIESHDETAMNSRVAFKILWNGRGADVLDREVRERF
jgi:hypothetical protein